MLTAPGCREYRSVLYSVSQELRVGCRSIGVVAGWTRTNADEGKERCCIITSSTGLFFSPSESVVSDLRAKTRLGHSDFNSCAHMTGGSAALYTEGLVCHILPRQHIQQ